MLAWKAWEFPHENHGILLRLHAPWFSRESMEFSPCFFHGFSMVFPCFQYQGDKEIAVIRMLSDNVKYKILKLCSVMDPISDTKKMIPKGAHAGRELISMLEGIIELNQFEVDDQVTKMNKLKSITEITLNLNELNNSDNLKDGRPSNELLTYHVTDDKDFTCFEPNPNNTKNLENLLP